MFSFPMGQEKPTYFLERILWAPLNSDQKGILQRPACTWEKYFLQEKQKAIEKKADKAVKSGPSLVKTLTCQDKISLLDKTLHLWNTRLQRVRGKCDILAP